MFKQTDAALEAIEDKSGDERVSTDYVLEAIDHLLDAMEGLDAPLTRELLGCAMMALVQECRLTRPATLLN